MSTFTLPLWEVIEARFGTSDDVNDFEISYHEVAFEGMTYGKLPTVPDWSALGMGTYPIFNPAYRDVLNGKIVDEFFNREIGQETIDEFMLVMRRTLDQIMPYYNQLYKKIDYDPLMTMDIHSVGQNVVEGEENVTGENTTTGNNKSGARVVNSNMPQTNLAGNADYATSATDTNSEADLNSVANQSSNSSNNATTNNDNRVTGFQGNAANLVNAYRASLINVDMMVLNDPKLQDCFFQLLNNGDSYHQPTLPYFGWY